MHITRQFICTLSKPTIFIKVLNHDISFIDMIEPLGAKEILSLKCEAGTILYCLMMSLWTIEKENDNNNFDAAMRKQVTRLLSETIGKSESILQNEKRNKLSVFSSSQNAVSELEVIVNGLKSTYATFSGKVCKTLLDVIDDNEDVPKEEVDPSILQQKKVEFFKASVSVVKMLADKMNTAVANGEISVEQVSNFLSYIGFPRHEHEGDVISIIKRLYFFIEDTELQPIVYQLVSTFLTGFSQYTLDMNGRNALHYAVNMCCYVNQEEFLYEIIQPILDSNPLIAYELDESGNNVIHYVLCSPYMNFKIVKYLYKSFPTLTTQRNIHGDTPLHIIAHTYFIYFATMYVMFKAFGRENIGKLRGGLSSGSISDMRSATAEVKESLAVLSQIRFSYFQQCLMCYRFLMTSVPLKYIFEEKNNAGCTVYNILGNNIYRVFYGDLDTLLQDFSKVSSTLPMYDYRISARHEKCLGSFFSGGHRSISSSSEKCTRLFYLDTMNMYNLISNNFDTISSIKTRCRDIDKDKNTNFQIVSFGLVIFMCLFVLNVVVIFKVEPILGIQPGVYRSILCLVASVSFFTVCCISSVLYCKSVDLDNKKLIEGGKAYMDKILLSPLDVRGIDIDSSKYKKV